MYVPERLNINLSTVPFVLKEVHVLIDVWSSACLCVSCSGGGFNIRGFECCSLLWCNTEATDKLELMNGKLLLMIVQPLLSLGV